MYSAFPHKELHESGLVGLAISEPYLQRAHRDLYIVDVVWGNDRGTLYPAGSVCQEWVDELEVIGG